MVDTMRDILSQGKVSFKTKQALFYGLASRLLTSYAGWSRRST